jgi:hypothetical protein
MPRLTPVDLEALDRDPASLCVVDAELRVLFVNRAWRDFGRENGAASDDSNGYLGVDLMGVVPVVLKPFYTSLFDRARATHEVVEHSYDCSSPTVARVYRMRIYPSEGGALVIAHTLSQEGPHLRLASPAIDATYRDERGIVTQCSHCRQVRRRDDIQRWDWVPDYAARSPVNTSHGLCALCMRHYFSEFL